MLLETTSIQYLPSPRFNSTSIKLEWLTTLFTRNWFPARSIILSTQTRHMQIAWFMPIHTTKHNWSNYFFFLSIHTQFRSKTLVTLSYCHIKIFYHFSFVEKNKIKSIILLILQFCNEVWQNILAQFTISSHIGSTSSKYGSCSKSMHNIPFISYVYT